MHSSAENMEGCIATAMLAVHDASFLRSAKSALPRIALGIDAIVICLPILVDVRSRHVGDARDMRPLPRFLVIPLHRPEGVDGTEFTSTHCFEIEGILWSFLQIGLAEITHEVIAAPLI